MTYDLSIYSTSAPALLAGARAETPLCLKEKAKWRIISYGTDTVEAEDIPSEVESCLPGIRFLSRLHVESSTMPSTAISEAKKLARRMAKESYGVVVDEQDDTLETPRGVTRLADLEGPVSKGPQVCLGWYFMEAGRMDAEGVCRLLDLMESCLPEMLPRRYGAWEPPQHKWEDTGKEHFLQLFGGSPSEVVWYPHKPGTNFFIGVPDSVGTSTRGFRCCHLEASFSGAVLESAAWRVQIQRFFVRVALLVGPFYAEIRLGSTIPSSWWWNGMPPIFPRAAILGVPYVGLWPEFRYNAQPVEHGLFMLGSLEDWPHQDRSSLPSIPTRIARPASTVFGVDEETGDVLWYQVAPDRRLPEVWPF